MNALEQLERRCAMLERRLAAMERLMGSPFSLARSTLAPDDTGAVQTVQLALDALSGRDAVPAMANFGHTSVPPIGTDFHVVFVDGRRSKAVAIASGHQTYRLRGLGVGDSALYDIRGAYAWLKATGPWVHCAGNPMTIEGDLRVTGSIIAGFGGEDQVGVQSHDHPQPADGHGDSEANTGPPTPGS